MIITYLSKMVTVVVLYTDPIGDERIESVQAQKPVNAEIYGARIPSTAPLLGAH